mmetsp:Transcript_129424/g.224701  ORF Transcript_129424/g.224701 Transcript_129424/m.224701 type:complete len:176 (-) Transcript_129424:141-668(-)
MYGRTGFPAWLRPVDLNLHGSHAGSSRAMSAGVSTGVSVPWITLLLALVVIIFLIVGLVIALVRACRENSTLVSDLEKDRELRRVRVKPSGREGFIAALDDTDLPYRVQFQDGALPEHDWFPPDMVDFLSASKADPSAESSRRSGRLPPAPVISGAQLMPALVPAPALRSVGSLA